MRMRQDGLSYLLMRLFFGCYLILQGIAQTDLLGRRYFPTLHKHFEEHYDEYYYYSIPWKTIGLDITKNTFRQTIGFLLLSAGFLLITGRHLKFATGYMTVIAAWSVYAHVLAEDPTYYVVCGALIGVFMLLMTLAEPEVFKEKYE